MKTHTGNFEDFDLFYKYTQDVDKYPLLTLPEEKKLLAKIAKGNKRALDKLICSNLRFVIKIAFLFRGRGLPITELINEGNIGLIRAAKEFDQNKNVKFITYAVWWVRQAINQALVEKVRTVRIPAYNEHMLKKVYKTSQSLKQYVGGEVDINRAELLNDLHISQKKLDKILSTGGNSVSLDELINMGQEEQFGSFTDENEPLLDVENASDRQYVKEIVGKLNTRERKVLQYFFGLNSNKSMNLREISDLLSISRERVRQIKEAALDKLRDLKLKREILINMG